VDCGPALRGLAGQQQGGRGDQIGARLRPGTEWFVTWLPHEDERSKDGGGLQQEKRELRVWPLPAFPPSLARIFPSPPLSAVPTVR